MKKNYENQEAIKKFSSNKTREFYTELLNTNPEYDGRRKCRVCGKDIFYKNVVLAGTYSDCIHINQGTSHLSTKTVNGVTYHIGVCEDCMLKEFPELEMKNMSRIYNMPTKYAAYAFRIPMSDIDGKKNELCIRNKETFVKKYGEEEGNRRWNEYREKQRVTNTFLYKKEKYGITLEEFNEYNKSRSCTLENFVKRYGEEEGNRRWDEYCYREAYTNSLEYYIEKYGNDGERKWKELSQAKATKGCSPISQELFSKLMDSDILNGHSVYYRDLNREYEVNDSVHKRIYYLDFYDETLNLCIEFNGNSFHPKKTEYSDDDLFKNPFMKQPVKAGIIRKREEEREEYLKICRGMSVITVWEDEYKSDREGTLNKIMNIIREIHG